MPLPNSEGVELCKFHLHNLQCGPCFERDRVRGYQSWVSSHDRHWKQSEIFYSIQDITNERFKM